MRQPSRHQKSNVRQMSSIRFHGLLAAAGASAAILLAVSLPGTASAARRATRGETADITRLVLRVCHRKSSYPASCRRRGSHLVSRVDARYAYAAIFDDTFFNGVWVKRPNTRSRGWRIIEFDPSGAQYCSYWTRFMPLRVVRDFRVVDWLADSSGSTYC